MSGLKNSPFGKRLRASRHDLSDDEGPLRNRPRVNPIFGVSGSSTPSLEFSSTTALSESSVFSDGTPSASEMPHVSTGQDYGDRFVPSRDIGDMRMSYNLLEESPSTPAKTRTIPTESDALKG
jgi:cell division cycle 20-like protein 1, cofactor of APC complex